jgi:hypothetical protein
VHSLLLSRKHVRKWESTQFAIRLKLQHRHVTRRRVGANRESPLVQFRRNSLFDSLGFEGVHGERIALALKFDLPIVFCQCLTLSRLRLDPDLLAFGQSIPAVLCECMSGPYANSYARGGFLKPPQDGARVCSAQIFGWGQRSREVVAREWFPRLSGALCSEGHCKISI